MIKKLLQLSTLLFTLSTLHSCIEPPIHWPEDDPLNEPEVQVQMLVDVEIQWNVDVSWRTQWFYGWDELDQKLWGKIEYPEPTSFEVRRYYLGDRAGVPHSQVEAFQVYENPFKRRYLNGYYDMLLWSEIDSPDGNQNVTIDDTDLQEVTASTTFKRGMKRIETAYEVVDGVRLLMAASTKDSKVTLLFDQPEVFYSVYPQDIHISKNLEDYEWNEATHTYIKRINCTLTPLVQTYLVQVIFRNNQDGKIADTSGDNAMSNVASGTSVNYAKPWDAPSVVYYQSRMKKDVVFSHTDTLGIKQGEHVDIIGGKLTTYGLCPSDPKNYVYVDLMFKNGMTATLEADVTDQVRKKPHGGIITIVLDSGKVPVPEKPDPEPEGDGSLFVPTVEDYDEIVYDIIM